MGGGGWIGWVCGLMGEEGWMEKEGGGGVNEVDEMG